MLAVGLRFRLAFGPCVVACAVLPRPSVAGVRCGRGCSGLGFGCVPPLFGGCWGVCVFVRLSRVVSCASWLGVLCRGVCLWARPACFPPFRAGARCVGVGAGPGSLVWPALLARAVGVGFALFFFFFRALWSLSPHPLSFGFGCWLFFFFLRGVCLCVVGVPPFFFFFLRAAVPGSVLPVSAGWSLCASLGVLPTVPSGWGVWPSLVVLACGLVAVGRSLAPPLPPVSSLLFFFGGGVCLFLPLPSLGRRAHWSAFIVVIRVAAGGRALFGRVPAPWVGWVMYTLGSVPLPAGLGPGSAGWAAAPGGFVWLWVRGLGLSASVLLRGAGVNFLGGPPAWLPGARWARVWPSVPVCGVSVWHPPGRAVACSG